MISPLQIVQLTYVIKRHIIELQISDVINTWI